MKSLYIMSKDMMELVVDDKTKKKIANLLGEEPRFVTYSDIKNDYSILHGVEYIFPSYGMEKMDEKFMENATDLKAVFFLGGSIKGISSEYFFKRNIPITCAATANAVPVAEFVLGEIILYLKGFFNHSKGYKEKHDFNIYPVKGMFRPKIGLVSYGLIAKHLVKLLRNFDCEIYINSPELDYDKAKELGLNYLSLNALFKECDVVSLHTPLLDSTIDMIKYEQFELMKENALFINSSRGKIVKEEDMIRFLTERKDVTAILDVTSKEPLDDDSLLFKLENVILTPHIAGATGQEKARLGYLIVDELERYLKGEKMLYQVDISNLSNIA